MTSLEQIIKAGEEEFDQEFAGAVLGTLSGEKGSPVFVNNELEIPRLKNFLREYALKVAGATVEAVDLGPGKESEFGDELALIGWNHYYAEQNQKAKEWMGDNMKSNLLSKTVVNNI